jgi:hypothetical protein
LGPDKAPISRVCQPGRRPPRLAKVQPTTLIPMPKQDSLRTLLITGAYGTGKTTLATELVDMLAAAKVPCAAIDIDWLDWAWLPGDRPHTVNDIAVANLRAMVHTFTSAGVERFVLAGTIKTADELSHLAAVVPGPIRVVQLTAPMAVIARRLRADALTSRAYDLAVSATEPDAGAAIADLRLANDGPIGELALRVLDWLAWR